MMSGTHVFEDQWGACIDRPEDGYLEIRWYDTTKAISGEQFNDWLSRFTEAVASTGRTRVLVDATQFQMDMGGMDMGWRDTNIIPRYNAAGVEKFAFQMPEGVPAIGTPPAPEGPAIFPTAYFGSRLDALSWLSD